MVVLPNRRRWFQFSMRGLLLLLTVVCGWLGYLTEAARRQRDAVAVLAPVAVIAYDDGNIVSGDGRLIKPRIGMAGLVERCLGKDYFDRVKSVMLSRRKAIGPDHLKAMQDLGSLQMLLLSRNESVDDSLVARIDVLHTLRELFVGGTMITEASFQPISLMPRLELLSAGETAIDGSVFGFFRRRRHSRISIYGTRK